jgi:hypothetical protein
MFLVIYGFLTPILFGVLTYSKNENCKTIGLPITQMLSGRKFVLLADCWNIDNEMTHSFSREPLKSFNSQVHLSDLQYLTKVYFKNFSGKKYVFANKSAEIKTEKPLLYFFNQQAALLRIQR